MLISDVEKLIKDRIKFNKKELRKADRISVGPYHDDDPTSYTLRKIVMYHKGAITELEALLKEVKRLQVESC